MQNISISRGHVLREWLPLVALAFSTFIFNTSEFIPIGLLSDIAADFAITESKAGVLITVYAWVVAIASLPLMLMVSGVESKRLMLGIFGLFVISHVGSALLVDCHPSGRQNSSQGERLHCPEHHRRRLLHRHDSRTSTGPRHRTGRRLENDIPAYRMRGFRRDAVHSGGPAQDARRKGLLT